MFVIFVILCLSVCAGCAGCAGICAGFVQSLYFDNSLKNNGKIVSVQGLALKVNSLSRACERVRASASVRAYKCIKLCTHCTNINNYLIFNKNMFFKPCTNLAQTLHKVCTGF